MTTLSPIFRIVTTTEDDHDVDLQAMDRVSKYPVFQTQMLNVSCSLCSAECDSKKKLERHMGKCHFRCYKCNKWIKTKQMLPQHIRDSCNFCDFCQEKFTSDDLRDRHMSDVHNRCGYCLKWMKEKRSLFYHINFSHSSIKEPFNCKFCEGKFISEYRLSRHLRSEQRTRRRYYLEEKDLKSSKMIKWLLFFTKSCEIFSILF